MTNEPAGVMLGGAASKAKIFVSYSRKDLAFADQLDAALRARGFELLIDRTEIYAFEDWWRRIEELIVKADTIVFVLSPDAVASDVCAKEVAFAASLNKRFAPIVHKPVDPNAVPEALNRLHFVFFTDEAKFEASADTLAEALSIDIGWVRKHTEIGQAARRWAEAGRPGPRGLLLRSPMLEEAELWIASRPEGGPSPTGDTLDFIVQSRKAASRRRNILTGGLAAGLAIALGLMALSYWMLRVSEIRRNDALIAQSRFLARDARTAIEQGNATLGALLALAALPASLASPDRPVVKEATDALEAAIANQRERLIIPNGGSINALAVSPDGSPILASARGKTVRVLNVNTGQELTMLTHADRVYQVRFSPDGARVICLVVGSGDKTSLHVWDAASGREIFTLNDLDDAPVFSSDGRRVLASLKGSPTELRDAQTGALIKSWLPKEPWTMFSPDGKTILATGSKVAELWSAETGEVVKELSPIRNYVLALRRAFSPDGSLVIVGSLFGSAQIFDTRTGAEIGVLSERGQDEKDWDHAAFSVDNSRMVTTAYWRETAHLWNTRTGAAIASFKHEKEIKSAAFSADGTRLVTVSKGRVSLWDASNGAEIVSLRSSSQDEKTAAQDGARQLLGKDDEKIAALFSPGGDRLLVSFDTTSTQLLDARTGSEIARLDGIVGSIEGFAFTGDKRLLVTVSKNGAAYIWDVASGHRLSAVLDNQGEYARDTTGSFLPDGNRLITIAGFDEISIRLWDVDPSSVDVFRGHAGKVNSATLSPDRNYLATAGADKTVRIWDPRTRADLMTLRGHEAEIHSVAFSPDGKMLVTASADKTARVWSTGDGTMLFVLQGHEDAVRSAVFSRDGKRILTASRDKTMRMWDAANGNSLRIFHGHDKPVFSAVFSPDGRHILSAEMDALSVWDVEIGTLIKSLKPLADRLPASPISKGSWQTLSETEKWNRMIVSGESLGAARRISEGFVAAFVTYSSDGTQIVGAPHEWLVEQWDVQSGLPRRIFYHDGPVWSARFSPDGNYVAAATDKGAVALWSVNQRSMSEPLVRLDLNSGSVNSVEFSANGDQIVAASSDGASRIWNVAHCQTLIDRARKQLPRELTQAERVQHYLTDESSGATMKIFATIRPYVRFLLPTSLGVCE